MSSIRTVTPEYARPGYPPKPRRWERLMLFLARACGLGLAPFGPGTFGSLAGLPLAWGIQQLPEWGRILAPLILFAVGVPICGFAARRFGLADPGAVVFDEIAAFSVVFLAVGINLATGVLG